MKFLTDRIDRFCYRHPNFGVPRLMLYLVACNVVVYLLDMFSNYTLTPLLYFSRYYILHGQVWRLITFLIVPGNQSILWFAISMYFYWFIGTNLEQEWGAGKFTIYYATGALMAIICGMITGYASVTYLNLSLFLAFATLYPNLQFLVFFIIPVKAKWLAWLDGAILILSFVGNLISLNWSGAALIVGSMVNYLIFFGDELLYYVRRQKRSTSRQSMNFKRSVNKRQDSKGYLHKCAVCGRTDTEYPDLEFRYCSKCVGYYCYCMDHINSHVHITE
jgi:membrane associated rhomboid family serine protease